MSIFFKGFLTFSNAMWHVVCGNYDDLTMLFSSVFFDTRSLEFEARFNLGV